ncbi:efflux transporter outer membrane subunit [Sphingobacterium sp. HJSM2_6]|uniref:efflux transporter outer membrane subunit n=1 Tax=Sphingobacterium sp. HJSM2_6 TaxID=3366264 RepID=UPI003BC001E7
MKRNFKFTYFAFFILFMLSACHVTKDYQALRIENNNLYRDTVISDTNSMAALHWKAFFKDKNLQTLIDTALGSNLDMKILLERIVQSQASFKQSKLAYLPDLNADLSVRQSRLAFPQGFGLIKNSTQYDLALQASWEPDIWGKLSSAKKAALAQLLQTEAAKRAIQSQLIADIAVHYYSLLALDAQLEVLKKTVNNRKDDVVTMKALKASAIVNGAAVVQSEANLHTVEVSVPDVIKQIRETENALSLLLGKPSGKIQRSQQMNGQSFDQVAVGLPASLLRFRPDVQEAEFAFRQSFELTNIARTAFYPNFRITAAAGFSSLDFSNWFSPESFFANILGGLSQPLFNKGVNKAKLKIAEAQQQQAFYQFQKIVLQSGKEVSDALFALETTKAKELSRVKQLEALNKAVEFTKELLKYSESTNYIDVLTSEQNLLNAEIGSVYDQLEQCLALIALYKATGGGSY